MKKLSYILIAMLLSSCASYYQRNIELQQMISKGELEKAEKKLESNKRIQRDRNRLLYLFNMGYINHMQQDFLASNIYFNEADFLIEDYKKKYGFEALALISNPEVKPYRAEDFESVMIHYYKSINYLSLKQFDASLVEARRMNLKLNQLNDKYKDHKNRYQADAFAHVLMGLSYEASGQLNDAFIAYRNAYNVFDGEHGYFGIRVPEQLKQDLMRTCYLLGFRSELELYEKTFATTYVHRELKFGEAIVIWQNGMGPVKDEVSFNFIAIPGQPGYIIFENKELGISFPFYIGNDAQKRKDLLALQVVRVAFPKYVERPPYYKEALLVHDQTEIKLELVEDINAIAFKTLQDRFVRETSVSLLRLALKKSTELALANENAALGAAATIANSVSEKADTRNWQTLPHSIYYARVPLNEGENIVGLKMKNPKGSYDRVGFQFEGKPGAMHFMPYHSLEHLPLWPGDAGASVHVQNK